MNEEHPGILDLIDNTLDDSAASGDAMRWVPDARVHIYETTLKRIRRTLDRDLKMARETLDYDLMADAYELATACTEGLVRGLVREHDQAAAQVTEADHG